MAQKKSGKRKKAANKQENPSLTNRLQHYRTGISDMEMRKTRRNGGWDSIMNAHMNQLPKPWPYTSRVVDPRIRTTILEKTARLLNSKLQGRLVPREGGDSVKARINNAVLDYQWDSANKGGSMIEKAAKADQYARLFGAAFSLNYWDTKKNCNEIKIIDPRDIFFDPTADHIRNAKWVQVREYTTIPELKARGYEVGNLEEKLSEKATATRDDLSIVKQNRGLEERVGEDTVNPVVELVTEWTAAQGDEPSMRYVFLPRYNMMLDEGENPYKHGLIPVSQLRYYPLGDDIYGESEVEPVLSLKRAIDAILCGYIDTMNLAMRPPVKLLSGEQRQETVVFGPGARWILNNIQSGQEVRIGDTAIQAFNNTYPALVAAFNTAMGDQSLGVSNIVGKGNDPKTATEVNSLQQQQNSRDQYNQMYLGEWLKDVMMQWLANNKQYLFDDPTKKFHIMKIVGREAMQELREMGLDEYTQSPEAINEIGNVITEAGGVPDDQLAKIMQETQVPRYPVIKNPTADSPEEYEIVRKMEFDESTGDAELYLTPGDFEGIYDYIPDVKSMAAGAGEMMQQARKQALDFALNEQVQANLAQEGVRLKMSDLLPSVLEDAGYKDADSLLEPIQAGQSGLGGMQPPLGVDPATGVPVPQGVPVPNGGPGMAQPQGAQEAGVPQLGLPQ